LVLDPTSRFAIVHATAADSAFVQNPNELIVVDLSAPPSATNPMPFTLRSFGGAPERIDFTPTLGLPGGQQRLLVVQTDRDVALIDLDDLSAPDVTVDLTESAETLHPLGFAVTDGDPTDDTDARIAIRLEGDANVVILDLLPPSPGDPPNVSYRPTPNIVAVGGVPSDIAFVRTDGGLRLAALVPTQQSLALVDPSTGVTTNVALMDAYDHIALVTDAVGGTEHGSDVALLWSENTSSIAFVALGTTVGKPYKSLDVLPLDISVSAVLDVPAPNSTLKVLVSSDGQQFYVLDLGARTASPLVSSESGLTVSLSPDGGRAWALVPGSPNLAAIDMQKLHPQNLILTEPIQAVFDIERRDTGRALLAVHALGGTGITVLDGAYPSLLNDVVYPAVLTGELP
jgi:hypothetical protein